MPRDPNEHRRRSIRLPDRNYTRAGAYFITICTHNRKPLFGRIAAGMMRLNDVGLAAEQYWEQIPAHFPHVELDAFVVMPDHMHGILWMAHAHGGGVGAQHVAPLHTVPDDEPKIPRVTPGSLGAIVRGFKSMVTRVVRQSMSASECPVWQRNYHERVIRNRVELHRIRRYIADNPRNWDPGKPH